MTFNLLVIIFSCLLLAYLAYGEFQRAGKRFLILRIVASVFLVGSFAALILPIQYRTKRWRNIEQLNLLTEGFSMDSIEKYPGKFFYSDASLSKEIGAKATFIPDIAYYLSEHPEINTIHALGYGLSDDELEKLDHRRYFFQPATIPDGFTSARWKQSLSENETLIVNGNYNNLLKKEIRIKLIGFGTDLDSVSIKPTSTQNFRLQHQIRQSGKAILSLLALDGKDTLYKEPIPVQTISKVPVKVLLLTSFPGFEYNFLKKWLYENNFPVAMRSQITKNKFSTDFLNTDKQKLDKISSSLLKKNDVLIIDQQEFEALSTDERKNITEATNSGMGSIILLNGENSSLPWIKNLKTIHKEKPDEKLVLQMKGKKLSMLHANQELYLTLQSHQQPMVYTAKGDHLVVQTIQGAGRSVFSTMENSYEWMLNGKQYDYAQYWSELIGNAARKHNPTVIFQTADQIPKPAKRQTFNIELQTGDSPKVMYNNKQLRANQNLIFPNMWTLQSYATAKGWNTVNINGNDQSFYVYNETDWQKIDAIEKIDHNNFRAKWHKKLPSPAKINQNINIGVSKWIFLIIILLSASFLWMESRISNNK